MILAGRKNDRSRRASEFRVSLEEFHLRKRTISPTASASLANPNFGGPQPPPMLEAEAEVEEPAHNKLLFLGLTKPFAARRGARVHLNSAGQRPSSRGAGLVFGAFLRPNIACSPLESLGWRSVSARARRVSSYIVRASAPDRPPRSGSAAPEQLLSSGSLIRAGRRGEIPQRPAVEKKCVPFCALASSRPVAHTRVAAKPLRGVADGRITCCGRRR